MKPYYTVDQETLDLLEATLHMCSHIADLPGDPGCQDDIYNTLAELAERFGIDPDPWTLETEQETHTVTPFRPFVVVVNNDKPTTDS